MKIAVTGGCGFIGSHLVDRLLADGHEVVILDNFVTGRLENVQQHNENKSLRIVEGDIRNAEILDTAFDGIDWVFHLAARADIVPSIDNPTEYHGANVDGTFSVLQAARKHNVKRFMYAASSSCFGLPDVFPTPETAAISPMYPYALTKWVGEQYVMHWGKTYDMDVVTLRLFNVYGPRTRTSGTYGAVFGVFLAQKLKGMPLTIVGDGEQTRDFTFVTDVADAFVRAAESDISGEVMNVGSGGTYSVNRLVELLGGDTVHIPKRPGEPDCTFADTAKIKRMLNWEAKVPFEDGVAQMLENIDYWKDAPVWDADSIKEATTTWFKMLSNDE
jgi:UDP-glucose 4-epimerase